MRLHKNHRLWLIFSLVVLGVAYAAYRRELRAPFGPSGGSTIGLTFGGVAAALVLFAALRGLRRWLPSGPIASDGWSRAHHWLGLLVVPLAWFHGGFRHGGALTCATMWLLYAIVISGGVGALLRYLTAKPVNDPSPDAPADESLEESVRRLAARAEDAVALCGPADGMELEQWRAMRADMIRSREAAQAGGEGRRESLLAVIAAAPATRSEPLRELYVNSVRPYLSQDAGGGVLDSRVRAGQILRRCRAMLPDEMHAAVTELERICDDCRRLRLRNRLRRYVDAWMLVHGPLSVALVILLALHGVMALRY